MNTFIIKGKVISCDVKTAQNGTNYATLKVTIQSKTTPVKEHVITLKASKDNATRLNSVLPATTIIASGLLSPASWTTKEGETKTMLEYFITDFEICGDEIPF